MKYKDIFFINLSYDSIIGPQNLTKNLEKSLLARSVGAKVETFVIFT